jgi:hypothetical protein
MIKNFSFLLLIILLFASCSSNTREYPPEATVNINGETIEIRRGTFDWNINGEFYHADSYAPYQMPEELNMETITVEPGSIADVQFADNSKPNIIGFLWDNEKRGQKLFTNQQQLTLPSEKGEHIIEIEANWENGECEYVFVVEVR